VSGDSELHEFDVGVVNVDGRVGKVIISAVSKSFTAGVRALHVLVPSVRNRDNEGSVGSVEDVSGELVHPSLSAVHNVKADLRSWSDSGHHLSVQLSFGIGIVGNVPVVVVSENAIDRIVRKCVGMLPIGDGSNSESFLSLISWFGVDRGVRVRIVDSHILRDVIEVVDDPWNVALVVVVHLSLLVFAGLNRLKFSNSSDHGDSFD